MRWAAWSYGWAMLAVGALGLGLSWAALSHHRKRLSGAVAPRLWARVFKGYDPRLALRKHLALGGVLALMAVALARPQWGVEEVLAPSQSLDVLLVLDVSRSMDSEDVAPSRLKLAKRVCEALLHQMPGEQFGLLVFAGAAMMVSPMTSDLSYVEEQLALVNTGMVSGQGTSLKTALLEAANALDRGAQDPRGRAIVLLSDGEEHSGSALTAAATLRDSGIPVFAVGVGTDRGAPIPDRDPSGRLVEYHKDAAGQTVSSRLHAEVLQKVAEVTGGAARVMSDSDVSPLVTELRKVERGGGDAERRSQLKERFQIFLWPALILLVGAALLPLRATSLRTLMIAGVLAGLGGGPPLGALADSSLDAYSKNREGLKAFEDGNLEGARRGFEEAEKADPQSARLKFNRGVVDLQAGKAEAAEEAFRAAESAARAKGDARLEAESAYNLGATHERRGNIEAAVQSYTRGIDSAKRASDARLENELRRKIEQIQIEPQHQPQPSPSPQDGQSGQKDPSQGNAPKPGQGGEKPSDRSKDGTPGKGPFRSDNLTREQAEQIMKELGKRDQALKGRLQKQKGQRQDQEKDW